MISIEEYVRSVTSIAITEVRPIKERVSLVLLEYKEPQDPRGHCVNCGRGTNVRSKAGYICSSGRRSRCMYVFECPVCHGLFTPQKPRKSLGLDTVLCSYKCNYKATLEEWKRKNPEVAREIAVRNGYRNIGAMREELERIQKQDRELFRSWSRKGGLLGGRTTAEKHPEIYEQNLRHELKHCPDCGLECSHKGGRCSNCLAISRGFESLSHSIKHSMNKYLKENGYGSFKEYMQDRGIGLRRDHCNKCGKITLHNGSRCFVCDPWDSGLDRESFYSQKIESVGLLSQEISLDSIDRFNGVPGVWSIETASGTCLEVCETIDIGAEMRLAIRKLAKGRENLSLTEDEIRDKYTRPGEYLKYRSIVARAQELGSKIVFKIIDTNVKNRQDRYIIEALYAHQNRAEFWSPSPLQNIQRLLNNSSL